jgi:hypothetical protein
MHRATEEQAQSECEWKRGKGVSSWIVGASVITLTLTKAAFSWKPFGRLTHRISQTFYSSILNTNQMRRARGSVGTLTFRETAFEGLSAK